MHVLIWPADLCLGCGAVLLLLRYAGLRDSKWAGEVAALVYIALIAGIAALTGAGYILFPELGALSHDVFSRPGGRWARSPMLLLATPTLTAIIGTVIARHLPYGLSAILLSVGCALLVIRALRSPVAPAISAGMLPLVLGVTSWWYPPAVAFGTSLLAVISAVRARYFVLPTATRHPHAAPGTRAFRRLSDYLWIPWFVLFLVVAYAGVLLTGWRFLLYPPLVVIAFEMLCRTHHCPWAHRPLLLPLICFLSASGGMTALLLLGANPLGAAASMGVGIAILKAFDTHVPPVLAVALLPFVIDSPTLWYPIAVGLGTGILTVCFLLYRLTFRAMEPARTLPASQGGG